MSNKRWPSWIGRKKGRSRAQALISKSPFHRPATKPCHDGRFRRSKFGLAACFRPAEKMRRKNLATANLMVFVHTNRFEPGERKYGGQHTVQLPVASADTGRLLAAARWSVGRYGGKAYRYEKAGVMLIDLVPAQNVQPGLFHATDDAKSKARMAALDVNRRSNLTPYWNGPLGADRSAFSN